MIYFGDSLVQHCHLTQGRELDPQESLEYFCACLPGAFSTKVTSHTDIKASCLDARSSLTELRVHTGEKLDAR